MTDFSHQSNEELADLFYEHRTAMKAVEKELCKRLEVGQAVKTNVGVFIKERAFYDQIAFHKI